MQILYYCVYILLEQIFCMHIAITTPTVLYSTLVPILSLYIQPQYVIPTYRVYRLYDKGRLTTMQILYYCVYILLEQIFCMHIAITTPTVLYSTLVPILSLYIQPQYVMCTPPPTNL